MPAKADMFGADVAVLAQILIQTIQELVELKQIFDTAQNSNDYLHDINRGINDALQAVRTVYPNADPGLYKQWDQIGSALSGVHDVYGSVVPSTEAPIQKDADQSVAETIALNNSIYKYTNDVDELGDSFRQYSYRVSPGGAEKLTAQTLAIMLTVMNESLRAQATGLKIQAQALAIQNHKDKESTKAMLTNADTLSASMKAQDVSFQLPRFE